VARGEGKNASWPDAPLGIFHLPLALAKYLANRASRVGRIYHEMSAKQRDKIKATMRHDLDRAANLETFEAMRADVEKTPRIAGPLVLVGLIRR
jgi:hypothetical protein